MNDPVEQAIKVSLTALGFCVVVFVLFQFTGSLKETSSEGEPTYEIAENTEEGISNFATYFGIALGIAMPSAFAFLTYLLGREFNWW